MNVSHLSPPSSEFHRTNISRLHCWCAQRTSNLSLVPSTFKAPCQPQGTHARVLLDGKDAVLQRKVLVGNPSKHKELWRESQLPFCPWDSSVWDNGATFICLLWITLAQETQRVRKDTRCVSIAPSTNLLILNIRLSEQILQYHAKNIFFV